MPRSDHLIDRRAWPRGRSRREAAVADRDRECRKWDGERSFGQAVPFGIISTTGIAGLTLSSGHGYLSSQYGLAVDNLLEAVVVLADGSFVTRSDTEYADRLWGLRGGGRDFWGRDQASCSGTHPANTGLWRADRRFSELADAPR